MRSLPVVDLTSSDAAAAVDRACRDVGFFYVVGHDVSPSLQARLEAAAWSFFSQPDADKAAIAMARGGPAWRGWFPVGGELTSGVPDRKEGIYFGAEGSASAGVPLHGPNQFPAGDDPSLRDAGSASRTSTAIRCSGQMRVVRAPGSSDPSTAWANQRAISSGSDHAR